MKLYKLIVLVLIGLFFSTSLLAQRERIEYLPNFDLQQMHWGYYLGLNKKSYKVTFTEPFNTVRVVEDIGFNVGLIGDLRLLENINLRLEPGLSTNTKTLNFNNPPRLNDSIREAGGTYLHLPLLLKFSTNRYNNIRPYVVGGISYDYNFSSNQDNPDDNSNGEFRLKKHNFMYEIGFGIDFYLYYFKFSPSIRGVFAINNELKYDDPLSNNRYTDRIEYLGTRGVFINLTFE